MTIQLLGSLKMADGQKVELVDLEPLGDGRARIKVEFLYQTKWWERFFLGLEDSRTTQVFVGSGAIWYDVSNSCRVRSNELEYWLTEIHWLWNFHRSQPYRREG